ncbi:MAG: 2-amino-4-hydroxy-6-hydroxymethyldihydropteridine diphosphokinase [Burkholderiales bacterium]|nr:2-amino-4-hydroxy-6-hydroxymethyldihydropteridine diphosphokinase [Burkholderiales bacterium]ODU63058.1 MAG: 2-amino-4-hydroxy-6-hydroxymethyldihydropteridine diphosphokinase [Lautropia sp. SCN 66-9]
MRAYVGLGANLGDAAAGVTHALAAIAALPEVRLLRSSSLYRSAPIDAGGPDFINAVALVDTPLSPLALLAALQGLEHAAGRERPYRNAPRTLDLDLLYAEDEHGPIHCETPALTLPHPRWHQRAFVLAPWAEIAGDLQVAPHGSLRALLAHCADQRIERIQTPTP